MRHALVAAFALTVSAAAADAVFLRLVIREDKSLAPAGSLPPGLRTFNMYAQFDGLGTASGPGFVNTILSVGQEVPGPSGFGINVSLNPGANFFQALFVEGATSNHVGGPDLAFMNPRALYDTFVSIGRKHRDSNNAIVDTTLPGPDFAFVNSDSVAGDPALGLGGGHDFVTGGWFNSSPPNLQGAAVNIGGEFLTILGQFSIANLAPNAQVGEFTGATVPDPGFPGQNGFEFQSGIFSGRVSLYRADSPFGSVEIPIVFTPLPPGPCAPDLNNDGVVNSADLALLLGAWGKCP